MNPRVFLTTFVTLGLMSVTSAYAQQHQQPGHESPAPGTRNDTASATKDAAGHAIGTVSAEMTSSLKGFTEAAAQSDMFEVEAGKIAAERTTNANVKKFAQEMVKAHTETTQQLKPLVAAADATIKAPMTLDDRHQRMIDELRGAKAADFDKRYLSQQVDAHKETLILVRGYAKDGDVSSVKGFAAKTAPVVQAHLDMAQKLYDAEDNKGS
jgi:putative membrane protein